MARASVKIAGGGGPPLAGSDRVKNGSVCRSKTSRLGGVTTSSSRTTSSSTSSRTTQDGAGSLATAEPPVAGYESTSVNSTRAGAGCLVTVVPLAVGSASAAGSSQLEG